MRLIDVDELLQKVGNIKVTDDIYNSISQIYENIKNQPTAYDVKKVVEQLEEATVSGMGGVGFNKNVYEIIDIVKRGGTDLGYNPYQE